jgi:hypothetical protein
VAQNKLQEIFIKKSKGQKLNPKEEQIYNNKFQEWKKLTGGTKTERFENYTNNQRDRLINARSAIEVMLKEELVNLEKLGRDNDAYYAKDKELQALEREHDRLSVELDKSLKKKSKESPEGKLISIREAYGRVKLLIGKVSQKWPLILATKATSDKVTFVLTDYNTSKGNIDLSTTTPLVNDTAQAKDVIPRKEKNEAPVALVASVSAEAAVVAPELPAVPLVMASQVAPVSAAKNDCIASKRKWDDMKKICLDDCVIRDGFDDEFLKWNSEKKRCQLECTGKNIWDEKRLVCDLPAKIASASAAEVKEQTEQQKCEEVPNKIWKDNDCVCKENFELRQEACEPVETAKKEKEGSDSDDFFNRKLQGPQIRPPHYDQIRLFPAPMHWSPGFI